MKIMKTIGLNVLREDLFTSIENVIECNKPIRVVPVKIGSRSVA